MAKVRLPSGIPGVPYGDRARVPQRERHAICEQAERIEPLSLAPLGPRSSSLSLTSSLRFGAEVPDCTVLANECTDWKPTGVRIAGAMVSEVICKLPSLHLYTGGCTLGPMTHDNSDARTQRLLHDYRAYNQAIVTDMAHAEQMALGKAETLRLLRRDHSA